jgi:hypothetical protein
MLFVLLNTFITDHRGAGRLGVVIEKKVAQYMPPS